MQRRSTCVCRSRVGGGRRQSWAGVGARLLCFQRSLSPCLPAGPPENREGRRRPGRHACPPGGAQLRRLPRVGAPHGLGWWVGGLVGGWVGGFGSGSCGAQLRRLPLVRPPACRGLGFRGCGAAAGAVGGRAARPTLTRVRRPAGTSMGLHLLLSTAPGQHLPTCHSPCP